MNESAILAAREERKTVAQYDLIRSIEKVMLGPDVRVMFFHRKKRKLLHTMKQGMRLLLQYYLMLIQYIRYLLLLEGMLGGTRLNFHLMNDVS
jgi:cell division protease FtsH